MYVIIDGAVAGNRKPVAGYIRVLHNYTSPLVLIVITVASLVLPRRLVGLALES